MNAKTLMTTALAGLLATAAHAITSEEIAAALDIDPSVGTFSCSGSADWKTVTESTHAGSLCMRSGALSTAGGDTTYSRMSLGIFVDRVTRFSFWVKTSCYSTSSYNSLTVSVDTDSTRIYAGETPWTKVSVLLIPGQHIVEWSYKCYFVTGGSNCAWVDDLKLEDCDVKNPSVVVSKVTCSQRTPWNGKVDIDYTVMCEDKDADIWVYPIGYDKDTNKSMAPRALEGDGVNSPIKSGSHRMTWCVTDDYPGFNSTAFTVKMIGVVGAAPYMVVDVSGGVDALSYPVSYLSAEPSGGWGSEYKTTKMVFRLIPQGSFMMGSPSDEKGRGSYETLHGVVLTKPFYIGVFECTQKQYQLVMGSTPSVNKGDTRPVENVTFHDIRGSVNGVGWPTHNQVDADSFMGRLRSKANMLFDLPTDAEWEYACRAGTSTALNNGENYSDSALKRIARCKLNSGDAHGVVGGYEPNAWGVYDMLGNVREHCRDKFNWELSPVTVMDPSGSATTAWGSSYSCRVCRGGSYQDTTGCRSAMRDSYVYHETDRDRTVGFRVYCSPVAE